jgi:hypothetical protein
MDLHWGARALSFPAGIFQLLDNRPPLLGRISAHSADAFGAMAIKNMAPIFEQLWIRQTARSKLSVRKNVLVANRDLDTH